MPRRLKHIGNAKGQMWHLRYWACKQRSLASGPDCLLSKGLAEAAEASDAGLTAGRLAEDAWQQLAGLAAKQPTNAAH